MENIIAGILAVTGVLEIYILIYIIASPRTKKRKALIQKLERANIFLGLFFAMTLGAFFFLNGPAYFENIVFDVRSAFGDDTNQVTDEPIFNLPSVSATDNRVSAEVTVLPRGSQMELVIPKIGVKTPIVFPSDTSTQGILKSLEKGVGVYPGSVMPGQRGHMIILGHSSLASWYKGDYARVFSLLNRLAVGDEFMIVSGDIKYTYKITANQVFKPAAADAYLALPAQGSVVDLITCDPVGSAANRRIVSAQLQVGG